MLNGGRCLGASATKPQTEQSGPLARCDWIEAGWMSLNADGNETITTVGNDLDLRLGHQAGSGTHPAGAMLAGMMPATRSPGRGTATAFSARRRTGSRVRPSIRGRR